MFVRKSQISGLVRKEKQRERKRCERENQLKLKNLREQLENENRQTVKSIRGELKDALKEKEKEIKLLKGEIERHYSLYQDIRRREVHLDQLSADLEDVVNSMVIKVQESLQPFYRSRAKIETMKRRSDRKNEKVESIFSAVK